MASPATLVAALEAAATHEDRGFSHLVEERRPVDFVSYAEIARRARRIAAALAAVGVRPGDRVALVLPDSAHFIDALFGCLYAGAIAVPIYPPMNVSQLETYLANTTHILRRAGCTLLLTDRKVRRVMGTLLSEVPSLRTIGDLPWLLAHADAGAAPSVAPPAADDVAFLQFTSGSTARPKGVTLTHANILANVDAIGGALGLVPGDDRGGVSWLPLYHDMGLIGCVFTPVRWAIAFVHFVSPLLFLKRPSLWLRTASERRAAFTFAPNFAYGLCASRIKDAELVGVDLSALTVAGCGAEPIHRPTLEAFAARFAAHGFRREALLPCYGLAEHTLAATFMRRGEALRGDRVDPEALAGGEARPPEAGRAVEVVCCGGPLPGHEVRIEDDEGAPVAEGRVGHVRLRGPSVMRGYWDDAAATAAALREGWLATGDHGYLKGGELYICGREKDLIIVNGRNHHPSDIEWQAGHVDGVRRGNVVAFGVRDEAEGRERVVVAAEVRDAALAEAPRSAIVARVLEALALRVDEVILLAPGSLPKTSSGKLQRRRTVELYRSGALGKAAGDAGRLGIIKHVAASQWGFLKARLGARTDGE